MSSALGHLTVSTRISGEFQWTLAVDVSMTLMILHYLLAGLGSSLISCLRSKLRRHRQHYLEVEVERWLS